jgi:hypothetical protein
LRTRHAKNISHTFRTQVDTLTYDMPKLPAYFDTQAQAAATLKIDLSELREAKAEGCPAFRSGRVYIAPLLAWFAEKRQQRAALTAAKTAHGMLNPGLVDDSKKDAELPKSHWDREKARVDYERALFSLEVDKLEYVKLDEMCAAVGTMLVGFRTATNMLPGSAARWLVGLKDFHAIKAKLENEVDAVLRSLGRCKYMDNLAPGVSSSAVSSLATARRAFHLHYVCSVRRRDAEPTGCILFIGELAIITKEHLR